MGTNVIRSARMLPNTKKIKIRWLNYYNSGTAKNVWIANPKVVEIPADSTANAVRQDGVYNGVTINTEHGVSVSRNDGQVTTMLNATEGITIGKRKSDNSDWESKVFEVDTDGNLVTNNMTANDITINGGSINWNNVSKPSYTPADIGAISSTYIDQNGIWTGSINANSITTGTLDVDRITLKGLDIKNGSGDTTFAIDSGGNVTLGGNITWGDKPSYSYSDLGGSKPPTDADNTKDWVTSKGLKYIDGKLWLVADYIYGDEITGKTIQTMVNGQLKGARIEGQTGDLEFYNNGTLGLEIFNGIDYWGLYPRNGHSLIIGRNGEKISFEGTIDFDRASVEGLDAVAKFG